MRDPVHGLSERLERICTPLNIRNVFITANNLKQVSMRVKLQIPVEKEKGIVYQVPCKDCDGVYTGESKRTLKVRLTDHRRAVVRSDVNNGIAVHVAKNEHRIEWGNARVVRSVRGYCERRATEAIRIRYCKNSTLNLDNGLHLPHLEPHLEPNLEIINNACFQIHSILFYLFII